MGKYSKNKLKKYAFTRFTKSGAKKEYRKNEDELEDHELESLYQQFAQAWDFQPVLNKNKFMGWLRKSLQERHDKKQEEKLN